MLFPSSPLFPFPFLAFHLFNSDLRMLSSVSVFLVLERVSRVTFSSS